MSNGSRIGVSAMLARRTLVLQVASVVPGFNLHGLNMLLGRMLEELSKTRAQRFATGVFGWNPSLAETRRIYESGCIEVNSLDSPAATEIFEIDISPSRVSSVLRKSAKSSVESKLSALADFVPTNFIRRLGRDLAWIVAKQAEIVSDLIVLQRRFLMTPDPESLEPISIASIAERHGVHPSTVSRLIRQISVRVQGKEFALSLLVPANRVAVLRTRSAVQKLAEDPQYSDGKNWLITAEALARVLDRMTGKRLGRRTVSKYLSDTGLKANWGRTDKPPLEEVHDAWRRLYGQTPELINCTSLATQEAARELEECRQRRLRDAVQRLCDDLSDPDFALTQDFIEASENSGFLLDGSKSSLMLKREPWTRALAYFRPGEGLELPGHGAVTVNDSFREVFSLSNAEMDRASIFIPWARLTQKNLLYLVDILSLPREN
jgi:transposase-like protein